MFSNQLKNAEEAKQHNEATGHANFEESTEAVSVLSQMLSFCPMQPQISSSFHHRCCSSQLQISSSFHFTGAAARVQNVRETVPIRNREAAAHEKESWTQ